MEIRNYINIILRRKFTILLTLIVTMIAVVIGTNQITPVYEASTTLRVAASAGGSIEYSDYMYADRLMNTYVNIATSRPMQEEVIEQLSLREPPEIKAEVILNTEFIQITVEYNDPVLAAAIANELADILVSQSNKLFIGGGKSLTEVLGDQLSLVYEDLENSRREYEALLKQSPSSPEKIEIARQLFELKQSNYLALLTQYEQVRFREGIQASMITIFERALIPKEPSKPDLLINIILGFIVGVLGGIGLAFIFENLDTTLHEVKQIEDVAEMPALVKIPKVNKKQVNTVQVGYSPFAETFRNMAAYFHVTNPDTSKRVLLFISAEPQQGKSTIAFHLSHSLAELGARVVVVDCDTRRPHLHSIFQLPNNVGLKDVLEQKLPVNDALQNSFIEGVCVLTSGSQLAHPSQMLSSAQMSSLVSILRREFDYVLLDSPAMLAVADVAALMPVADGLIFVVRQGHAHKEEVRSAGIFTAKQNGKSAFMVINQAENNGNYGYYKNKRISKSLRVFEKWGTVGRAK